MTNLDEQYPSNSKVKPPQKEAVTKARIIAPKKPLISRIFGDNFQSVGQYITWEVLMPALKSTINDIVSNGISMLLYGEGDRSSRIRREKTRSYVSYNRLYDERDPIPRKAHRTTIAPAARHRTRHRFDDIVIGDRAEAETVLDVLLENIEMYGVTKVADFYELVGLESDWADNNWGWDNLVATTIKRVRDGYILDFPKPVALD